MGNDFEIGRVVAVDTAQVTIELNPDLKALTRTTYEGTQEVGRINSYVILPVGARRLVAMVTRVSLTEEADLRPDRVSVTLPAARRIMKATLIGTIDGNSYTPGVSIFPVLDNPVHLVTTSDLNLMFDVCHETDNAIPNPEKPGYCIRLGDSVVFEGYPIRIDPDAFFGKHAAVLGSTGSGKSCTIASLLQSILEREEIRQTNIIILDTNGEYRTAFQNKSENGWKDVGKCRCLYIPSDPGETANRLVIPYWFLNADDFVRLFRAREGLQAPVLLRALRFARSNHGGKTDFASIIDVLRTVCAQLIAYTENDNPNQQWALPSNINKCCKDSLGYRKTFPQYVTTLLDAGVEPLFQKWERALQEIQRIIAPILEKDSKEGLGATKIQQIQNLLRPIEAELNELAANQPDDVIPISADQPRYFSRCQFLEWALETAMREQAESGSPGRIRENCGPMFLRIRRFFEDPRFRFLFDQYPDVEHVLATFLRDILGLPSASGLSFSPLEPGKIPFYDRQRAGSQGHHVVILDLSLLATEVLENVTALIGRLLLEFLQQLGEFGGENSRGSLPVVLVLEEAQNYIREPRRGEEESISRLIFERIAREGRKYGLGLVVSSQRPSELSKTVLSQCSSFIVHRLQNPEDLRYFQEIVPGIYKDLLNQLPALAPQTALVLGECVRAPALVKIREAQPVPRSQDPRFYEHWVAVTPSSIPVEEICARWEGKERSTASPAAQEAAAAGSLDIGEQVEPKE